MSNSNQLAEAVLEGAADRGERVVDVVAMIFPHVMPADVFVLMCGHLPTFPGRYSAPRAKRLGPSGV